MLNAFALLGDRHFKWLFNFLNSILLNWSICVFRDLHYLSLTETEYTQLSKTKPEKQYPMHI